MATSKTDKPQTTINMGVVRASYCHVWQPSSMEGSTDGKKKYSVSLIIPKSNTQLVELVQRAQKNALDEGVASKFGGKAPINPKLPLRDGDVERPNDEAYKNSWFLSATSTTKPGIVDINRQEITDESEFYSGVYCRANVNFYPFNFNGLKGVACGLNHLQKVKDGEPLAGRGSAVDAFDDDFTLDELAG